MYTYVLTYAGNAMKIITRFPFNLHENIFYKAINHIYAFAKFVYYTGFRLPYKDFKGGKLYVKFGENATLQVNKKRI